MELGIAYGQHFVHHQDFGLQEGGDGKAQTDGHAAGVAFHRGINVAFHSGEIDNLVQLAGNFVTGHAHDGAVHIDVFTTGQLGMEACAYFEQGGYASPGADASGGRGRDAREEFQQGGFARPVLADDAHHIALAHVESDVFQRPYIIGRAFLAAVVGLAYLQIRVFLT